MDATTHRRVVATERTLHWPEYAIEAALLGAFMLSACSVTALIHHPASPLRAALPDPLLRRALVGIGMGLTAIALIHSPWGQRSGAHFNPSVTLTFLRLGTITPADAMAYVVAQCLGGIAGVLLAYAGLGMLVSHPAVGFVATAPGPAGVGVAFAGELAISFVLMSTVLRLTNGPWARWTGLACGALVATYITVEAPYSGMSMNPARSLASAVVGGQWSSFWIYITAPPLGMLAAAELWLRQSGPRPVRCAKLNHNGSRRCIFRCAAAPET